MLVGGGGEEEEEARDLWGYRRSSPENPEKDYTETRGPTRSVKGGPEEDEGRTKTPKKRPKPNGSMSKFTFLSPFFCYKEQSKADTKFKKKNRSVWDGWRRSEVGFELEPGLFWTKKESEDEQLRVTILGDILFPFKAKKINLGSHAWFARVWKVFLRASLHHHHLRENLLQRSLILAPRETLHPNQWATFTLRRRS